MTPIHWPEEQLLRLNALGEFVQYQVMEYALPVRETKRAFRIDYFYIDDNASCLPLTPRPPKKLCITIVSNFSWAVVPREIDDNGYAIFFLYREGEEGEQGVLWPM